MPGFFDPFTPGQTNDPTAGVDPSTYDKIRGQWDSFMGNPQGRAAMLSAGLALMQPPSFGDTGMSQLGRAIGAAGESATGNEAMDMKKRETDIRQQEANSKEDLRASQAMAAEARAGTAEARVGAAGSRLDLQREQLKSMNERNLLANRVRLSGMYQNYVKDVAKRNADPLRTTPPDPVLPMSDWVKANPMLNNLGLMPSNDAADDATADGAGVSAASPATTSGTPTTGAPPAPSDPKQRQPNMTYTTPRGPLKWTGQGWTNP
jgi:hypothetical protein